MNERQTRTAFSLLEVLIVIAFIAVLASLGAVLFGDGRARRQVEQAAEQLARDIDSVRNEARAGGAMTGLNAVESGDTSYVLDFAPFGDPAGDQIRQLPPGVSVASDANAIAFRPPYGTWDTETPSSTVIVLGWRDGSVSRDVIVAGVMGRAVVRQ